MANISFHHCHQLQLSHSHFIVFHISDACQPLQDVQHVQLQQQKQTVDIQGDSNQELRY